MPGVKLNFGKTGMSVSAGVPGFRKTLHSSGKVTTSVGIPGTGISYITTENKRKENVSSVSQRTAQEEISEYTTRTSYDQEEVTHVGIAETETKQITKKVTLDIHKVVDEEIDWTEFLVNALPPDNSYNSSLWEYCHSVAARVLSGDIDTYLTVIQDINPLGDLLEYGTSFEFGTDSPQKIEVEFQINQQNIAISKTTSEYQDYVCSIAIRIARDMFALLPVQNVIVHAMDSVDILSVCFDKKTFSTLKFNFIDPSDTVNMFNSKMNFNETNGFNEITRLKM